MRAPWRFVLSTKSVIEVQPQPREKQALAPRDAVLRMAPYHPPTGGRRNKLRFPMNAATSKPSPRMFAR